VSTQDSGPVNTDPFRAVLGHFCSGVTVVAGLGPDGPYGLTCQSFCSLSLDPRLVLFSAARSSTSWPRIRRIGAFCVNILAEDQQHVSIQLSGTGGDKFAGLKWHTTPLGAPRLDGAVAWLDCTIHAEHNGGDHTIVVGAVHDLAIASGCRPLVFHRGRYTTLSVNSEHQQYSIPVHSRLGFRGSE
jgi:3-hydroxy-9,10-secoandrosta-1,3,5(10)-triene-9,17-dione monooxygenase reductase component